jgi:glycosyltransferase involved in cell wall biosynthesis
MLLGVPCVAADTGGIPDLMVSGQDGIIYPAGDIRRLSEAVNEILGKDDVSRLYSISAKKHAYKTHDPEVNFRRLMEIYRNIADRAEDK